MPSSVRDFFVRIVSSEPFEIYSALAQTGTSAAAAGFGAVRFVDQFNSNNAVTRNGGYIIVELLITSLLAEIFPVHAELLANHAASCGTRVQAQVEQGGVSNCLRTARRLNRPPATLAKVACVASSSFMLVHDITGSTYIALATLALAPGVLVYQHALFNNFDHGNQLALSDPANRALRSGVVNSLNACCANIMRNKLVQIVSGFAQTFTSVASASFAGKKLLDQQFDDGLARAIFLQGVLPLAVTSLALQTFHTSLEVLARYSSDNETHPQSQVAQGRAKRCLRTMISLNTIPAAMVKVFCVLAATYMFALEITGDPLIALAITASVLLGVMHYNYAFFNFSRYKSQPALAALASTDDVESAVVSVVNGQASLPSSFFNNRNSVHSNQSAAASRDLENEVDPAPPANERSPLLSA